MNTKLALLALSTAALAAGCGSKTASYKSMDIIDPAMPTYAPPQNVTAAASTPAPQPVAQPVVYDSAPAPQFASAQTGGAAMGGGSYQVKRGDTLFSIAKGRYGNGNQWQKIASANPGLTPQSLKAGQTISLP